jgi:hypothetical protein
MQMITRILFILNGFSDDQYISKYHWQELKTTFIC